MRWSEFDPSDALFLAKKLRPAVERISTALRQYVRRHDSRLGSDCCAHASIGRELLEYDGIQAETVVGYAVWKIGNKPLDLMGFLPRNGLHQHTDDGPGLTYHAWIHSGRYVVDLTTYQLPQLAARLDVKHGGVARFDWSPAYLIVHESDVRSRRFVIDSSTAGSAYYEARPELATRLHMQLRPRFTDVAAVRQLMDKSAT